MESSSERASALLEPKPPEGAPKGRPHARQHKVPAGAEDTPEVVRPVRDIPPPSASLLCFQEPHSTCSGLASALLEVGSTSSVIDRERQSSAPTGNPGEAAGVTDAQGAGCRSGGWPVEACEEVVLPRSASSSSLHEETSLRKVTITADLREQLPVRSSSTSSLQASTWFEVLQTILNRGSGLGTKADYSILTELMLKVGDEITRLAAVPNALPPSELWEVIGRAVLVKGEKSVTVGSPVLAQVGSNESKTQLRPSDSYPSPSVLKKPEPQPKQLSPPLSGTAALLSSGDLRSLGSKVPGKATSESNLSLPSKSGSRGSKGTMERTPTSSSMPGRQASLSFTKHSEGTPWSVYICEGEVGSGTFGSVSRGRHRHLGSIHAIKAAPKEKIESNYLWEEIQIMQQLDHPHILRLHHTFEDEQCIYMASDMCVGGDLFHTIIEAGSIPEEVVVILFTQIMAAVSYLHNLQICHRDLKPENFLVAKRCKMEEIQLKLIDFGTARRFDLKTLVTKVCTPRYVAPEILAKGEVPYTERVDVWSCGVMLYFMLSGRLPFSGSNDVELLKAVKKGRFEFKPKKIWSGISRDAQELVWGMLQKDVTDRFTAQEARRHDWCKKRGTTTDAGELVSKQMQQFSKMTGLKKVALQIIARHVSDELIEDLREVFLQVDQDNLGMLDAEDIERMLSIRDDSGTGLKRNQSFFKRLHDGMDLAGSGVVGYTGFLAAAIGEEIYMREDVCRAAFHCLDLDGDGIISQDDLAGILQNEHNSGLDKKSRYAARDLLKEIPDHESTGLSYEDFLEVMGSGERSS